MKENTVQDAMLMRIYTAMLDAGVTDPQTYAVLRLVRAELALENTTTKGE